MAARRRILIVEDDPGIRTGLAMAMEDTPHLAVLVESAEEAERKLATGRFDAVICDKNLPGKSGTDLLRQIRKEDQEIVFVMITAFASADNAVESMGLGIDAYVHKPFDVFALIERVEGLLDKRARRARSDSLAGAKQHFQKATEALQALTPKDRRRALIVSPDANEREWFTAQLSRLGLDIDRVASQREADETIRDGALRLVVLDGRLGWEETRMLVTNIRTRDPDTGMVVVSDERPPLNVVTDLINMGVGSLLTRPVDAARFRTGVERVTRIGGSATLRAIATENAGGGDSR